MLFGWPKVCGILELVVAGILFANGAWAAGRPGSQAAETSVSAQELMREVVQNELGGPVEPPTYWCFREVEITNGVPKTYEVYQTKGGTVRKLVTVNGQPLAAAQAERQKGRLDRLLHHSANARSAAKAHNHDVNREEKLFRMLPHAFLFRYDGREGNLVKLAFQPNPQFVPPDREAQVFHHMAGFVLIDPEQKRLAEINGRLTSEVKFFWGLLGHLDKGGTFHVWRADEGGGNWKLVRLEVNMQGEALFFETIGIQENKRYLDYHQDPASMTLADAVEQLIQNQQMDTGGARTARKR